ncbi:MAG: hypothetical protein KDK64_00870 [Chlamydiia bacterium]|nr:hypothetical protein [Chlamydiia bacterium]
MKKSFIAVYIFLLIGSLKASQTVIVDPHFSPYSGSANLLTAEGLLILGEDALFPGGGRNTTSKVWGRALEQLIFWQSIGTMTSVAQHEIFGHGYRLRELGVTPKRYVVTPWGGATYFEVKESFKVGDMMAVIVAGLEAESIMAWDLKTKWLREGKIDGRLSPTYNQAQQSLFWYTLITQLGRLHNDEISEGNDVDGYLKFQNATYIDSNLTIGQLTRWSLFNWLDPMTFYSYYAFFYYMAEGKSWAFPMIPLGKDIRYLPNVKIAYAPYAPEAYLENFFIFRGNPVYFYFKGGKRSFGSGFVYDHFFEGTRGALGLKFDGWNQGVFVTPATLEELEETGEAFRPSVNKRRWGAALSLRGTLNFTRSMALYTELGGKTSGYLPGYGLDKEIIGRIGIQFGPNSLRQKMNPETKINAVKSNGGLE